MDGAAYIGKDGIRRRGAHVTRLEAFTDAAFAFALTLLVIAAGELPRSVADLATDLRAIPAFVGSFAIVALFWAAHYGWSRRYGLETPAAVLLSLAIVLIVLIWVYPLRMIAGSLFHWLSGGFLTADFAIDVPSDLAVIFVVYGLGYAALSLAIALLYRHALAQAETLELTPDERIATGAHVLEWLVTAGIALTSVAIAAANARRGWGWYTMLPGIVYFLIGFASPLAWRVAERRRRALQGA